MEYHIGQYKENYSEIPTFNLAPSCLVHSQICSSALILVFDGLEWEAAAN